VEFLRRLNDTCGTQFRRFEDIDLPRDASPYGLYFDRWRFNQDRFLAFTNTCASAFTGMIQTCRFMRK